MGEIQAYEASASNPAFFQEDSDEEREITFSVVNDYGERGKHFSEMVKAKKAFDSIRTLRILGLNDREIGRVVSRARFNGKECTYPKLEKKIMEERKKWGIEDEETFRKVVGALLARQELELYVQRHHAQRIATEQLEIASGKKGWLKR